MSRIVSRAEAWESVYQAFNDINFTAFDYNTIKQSLLDYVKLYFPENFNDYIESSEFIAILEIFAYVGELLAYRIDLNAHENFLTTAQRKESILRLAKLISYSASRNIPARGLIKITSVSTTETVLDTLGVNLANRVIRWNDQSNTSWKEQFLLVLNRVLSQEFGTVKPNDRVQIDDVLFELYPLDNVPLSNGVSGFSTTVAGTSLPMELVPVSLSTENGIFEKRPENNSLFTILYGSDGLGDTSDTTGFFCLLKQGKLQKIVTDFDGVTPNQTYDILVNNINDTDVWVNNIDTTTGETIDDGSVSGHKSGEWVEVDLAHAQNIVFNTNTNRHKYEINTLNDDNIRFIFGDGEFADIPSGRFDIWFRTSDNSDVVVPQNSVINQPVSISYVDDVGSTQTFSFTVSLINSLQNAASSEDIEHIRSVAPAVYYTQDRMVNGRDYNTYMLQDPSILKLRSINRTYAGDSKYITWHDPRETYENVKMFGDDLLLYFKEDTTSVTVNNVSDLGVLITGYIQPLLASTDIFTKLISSGVDESDATRRVFTSAEVLNLGNALTLIGAGGYVYLSYDISLAPNQWNTLGTGILNLITIQKDILDPNTWYISHVTDRLISESQTTRFWNTNNTNTIVDYDSLIPGQDTILVLKANDKHSRDRSLSRNYEYNVVGQELVAINLPDANLPDIHRLNVLPVDTNDDNIPNDMDLYEILNPKITVTPSALPTSGYQIANFGGSVVGINPTGLALDTSGYQIATFGGSVVGINPTGLAPDAAGYQEISFSSLVTNTAGYQTANFGGSLIGTNPTGLVAATTYVAYIIIDGNAAAPIVINVNGSIATNFNNLITEINNDLGAFAIASIDVGNLKITSTTTGVSSSILVTNGDLLNSLTGFISTISPVSGTTTIGTNTTGLLAATTYVMFVAINGATSTPTVININGSAANTFNNLITEINTDLGANAIASIVGNKIRITSLTTGVSSSILVTNGDLLNSLTGFISTITPVSGTTTNYTATVTVNGGIPLPITINGNSAQTFNSLITEINTDLGGAAIASIDAGNLKITSSITGVSSSILITDITLFSTLTGLVGLSTPIVGTTTNYTATVTVDGIPHSIIVNGNIAQTYNALITEINNDLSGTGIVSIDAGNLKIISATTSIYSSVLIIDTTLFATLLGYINFSSPVAGTFVYSLPQTITLPIYYIVGATPPDVTVTGTNPMVIGTHWQELGTNNTPSNQVEILTFNGNTSVTVTVKDYVYFNRLSAVDEWVPQPTTVDNINLYLSDLISIIGTCPTLVPTPYSTLEACYSAQRLWKRYNGRDGLNFAWFHKATSYRLIDPAASNIIDTYIITRGYYTQLRQWLNGITTVTPDLPTPLTLRTDYGYMIDNKMISDTMILHPGKIKLLFGSKAIPTLQATFKVIRPSTKVLTDNQVKNVVVDTIKTFFDINTWEFGETFYFTELSTAIHNALPSEIDSVVLVPKSSSNQFGDMFQVIVREDEILQPDISVIDVEIVTSYNTQNLRQ